MVAHLRLSSALHSYSSFHALHGCYVLTPASVVTVQVTNAMAHL
jgi:hypothetical protein